MDNDHLPLLAAKACEDKKGIEITLININRVSSLADWIVIAEGQSDIQVKAIVKSVEDTFFTNLNLYPLRKEGVNEAKWALLDYGDIIINIFQPTERRFYELESFWSHGEKIDHKSLEVK